MNAIKIEINNSILELLKGDITKQDTEAVVNAANGRLASGGGVAGAIHRTAGPGLWKECKKLGGCETGKAKITSGYDLPNKFVIHTVGPVYSGAKSDPELLNNSYFNSLKIADENGIESISFPALSTGAFGYPVEEAARIALQTIINYLKTDTAIKLVRMVLYDSRSYEIHKTILDELGI